MHTKNAADKSVQAQYPAVKFAYENLAKEIGTLKVIFGSARDYELDFGSYEDAIAFYDGRRFFLNTDYVDINDKAQVTNLLAHEIGHLLYAPMDKQVKAICLVIIQKAYGCGEHPHDRNGNMYSVPEFANYIDDQIVNLSVMEHSNPEVAEEMRRWIKRGAPIKTGKTYEKVSGGSLLWNYHVDVMMDFSYRNEYPDVYLKNLVKKGKGLHDPEEYFKNYYDYVAFVIRTVLGVRTT